MMNTMEINGYRTIIQYDPEIDMFRGEFIGLSGGADFYATGIEKLKKKKDLFHCRYFLMSAASAELNQRKITQVNSMCVFLLSFMRRL